MDSAINKSLFEVINEVNAVVNLAGENVGGRRWNEDFKKRILDSRVSTTNLFVTAIKQCEKKPSVYVSASAVGYYGAKHDGEITEDSEPGNDFMADVTKEWEAASEELKKQNIRRVILRFGIVLSKEDGALKKMLLPFKLFIGGPLGSGKQWFPWIHIEDVVRTVMFSLDEKVEGPFNVVAPGIVSMKEFCKELGVVMKRPSLFQVPGFILRLVLGEFAEYVLNGAKIKPTRLKEVGFEFKNSKISEALKDLL